MSALGVVACGGDPVPEAAPTAQRPRAIAAEPTIPATLGQVLGVVNGFTASRLRVAGRMTISGASTASIDGALSYAIELLVARSGGLRLTAEGASGGFEMASDGNRVQILHGGERHELAAVEMPSPTGGAPLRIGPLDLVDLLLPPVFPPAAGSTSRLAFEARPGESVLAWYRTGPDESLAIRRRASVSPDGRSLLRVESLRDGLLWSVATYAAWRPDDGPPTGTLSVEWPALNMALHLEVERAEVEPLADAGTFRLWQ